MGPRLTWVGSVSILDAEDSGVASTVSGGPTEANGGLSEETDLSVVCVVSGVC